MCEMKTFMNVECHGLLELSSFTHNQFTSSLRKVSSTVPARDTHASVKFELSCNIAASYIGSYNLIGINIIYIGDIGTNKKYHQHCLLAKGVHLSMKM